MKIPIQDAHPEEEGESVEEQEGEEGEASETEEEAEGDWEVDNFDVVACPGQAGASLTLA